MATITKIVRMKKKFIRYAILPVMALTLLSAGVVSAHGWFGFGSATPEEIAARQESMFEKKADILSLSVDQVKTFWAQGKTFQEIAAESGLTKEELRERMKESKKARLQEKLQTLVDQGVIDQTQADQRLQVISERIEAGGFGKKGFRHSFGQSF